MATFKKFEEIEAWQLSRSLCEMIYEFINRAEFSRDYKLRDQINGSSGSIMDNIAEGFERGGNNEFVNFLRYSKGSSGETRSQLYRALSRNYISIVDFEVAYGLAENIACKNQSLITYLQNSNFVGPNYKNKKK